MKNNSLLANIHTIVNMKFKYTVPKKYFIAHKQELLHSKAMHLI